MTLYLNDQKKGTSSFYLTSDLFLAGNSCSHYRVCIINQLCATDASSGKLNIADFT